MELFQELSLVAVRKVLDRFLEDAASECVHGELEGVPGERIRNGLGRVALDDTLSSQLVLLLIAAVREIERTCLDDMVGVRRLDAINNLAVQLSDDGQLLVLLDPLQGLLDHLFISLIIPFFPVGQTHPAPIHLHRKVQHLPPHLLAQCPDLLRRPKVKELLDDIVAKHISHERESVGEDLGKHGAPLVLVGVLELGLDESRAVLVAREFDDVTEDFLYFISYCSGLHSSHLDKRRETHVQTPIPVGLVEPIILQKR